MSLVLGHLYISTFKGSTTLTATHKYFCLDCGNYSQLAKIKFSTAEKHIDKILRHPLTIIVQGWLWRQTHNIAQVAAIPTVAGLIILGIWAVFACGWQWGFWAVTLTGLSFTPWFTGSIIEARSMIFLGVVLWWIGVWTVSIRPTKDWSAGIAAILTIPLLLISVGNAYLLPVVPLVFLASRVKKGLLYGGIYLFLVGGLFFSSYTMIAYHHKAVTFTALKKQIQAYTGKRSYGEIKYLTSTYFSITAGQAIINSVAGIPVPYTSARGNTSNWWAHPTKKLWALQSGKIFLLWYASVALSLLYCFWQRGFLVGVALGIFLGAEVVFWAYLYPWAGAAYFVAVPPVLWGSVIYIYSKTGNWPIPLVAMGSVILFLHNYSVMLALR